MGKVMDQPETGAQIMLQTATLFNRLDILESSLYCFYIYKLSPVLKILVTRQLEALIDNLLSFWNGK